jgi:hydroxymethylpyrimidine/phosphomethylpyrimidine kinase
MTPPVVVSIAATDSGGAAGLAADLATFAALGVHGALVVSAVTAQDTRAIHTVHGIPPAVVEAQLDAVFGDLAVAAAKTGMLGHADIARVVAERTRGVPLVVDPVLRASTGRELADAELIAAYRTHLLPIATVVTPNVAEARILAQRDGDAADLARQLTDDFGCAVVVTGGPDGTNPAGSCTDWLATPGQAAVPIDHPGVPTTNDHGTGCTFASAVAASLAHGRSLDDSIRAAAQFTADQLRQSRAWQLGHGRGPIAHLITKEPS